MNDLQQSTMSMRYGDTRTPIEIALNIDEHGMTTARALYAFLEMDSSHYSRWVKSNITGNEFATEGEDYWRLAIDGERENTGFAGIQPNPTEDFRLSAHFAKKLSMKGNGKKSEMAREYFAIVEKRAKEAALSVLDISGLSQEMQMMKMLSDNMIRAALEQKKQSERIDKVEKNQQAIRDAVMPVTDNWRASINRKFNRIQERCGADFRDLRHEMYVTLKQRAGCNLNSRVQNLIDRMEDRGASKTEINRITKMDVIESDKRLREIFAKIVTEYEIKYCTEVTA